MKLLDVEVIRPGTVVRHQKRGTRYEIVTIGKLEATLIEHVVYRNLADSVVWIRPLVEFMGNNEDGVPRFVVEGS
jgi:hypothetical protein